MICSAKEGNLQHLVSLSKELWPHSDSADLLREYAKLLKSEADCLLLYFYESAAIAFSHCSLRRDYVEGTSSSPVGYLEGIYVRPEYRNRGIAKQLLIESQKWAKKKRCKEFASDCELDNTDSYHFHLKSGFREARRVICFVKKL